jgi:hypothetical protein
MSRGDRTILRWTIDSGELVCSILRPQCFNLVLDVFSFHYESFDHIGTAISCSLTLTRLNAAWVTRNVSEAILSCVTLIHLICYHTRQKH